MNNGEGKRYEKAKDRKRERFLAKNDRTRRFAGKQGNHWTREEDEYLIAHYGTVSTEEIARRMGRSYCSTRARYSMIRPRDGRPIRLQALLHGMREDHRAASLSYRQLANAAGISSAAISNLVNHGIFPQDEETIKKNIEEALATMGIPTDGIWEPHDDELIEGEKIWEGDMLKPVTKKHFRLFRDPFNQELESEEDLFYTPQYRYVQEAILDAARYRRFIAVVGEVGSGKTTILRTVETILAREGEILVVKIASHEKEKCSAVSITEAIIDDLTHGNVKPDKTRETRDRQVKRILQEVYEQGRKAVLIMDEAHAFSHQTLRSLKRFYENEIGFIKLLGIVLLGQPELLKKFEDHNIREMVRRCTLIEMEGLNGHVENYIVHKLERAGADVNKIFHKDAIEAINVRLRPLGQAQPLMINLVATRAMNATAFAGEELVTPEIIDEIN